MRVRMCLPLMLCLSACATTGTGVGGATGNAATPGDPYEKINRKIWSVDETLDRHIVRSAAKGYVAIVPAFLRHGLGHMLDNVEEPFNAINSLLQAQPKRALNSVGRFLVNTTVGIGGFTDRATKMGLRPTPEDLGQTFAVWGARKSSYLVLPFYGPSTIRDGLGTLAAQWADPYHIVLRDHLSFWGSAGVTAFELLDARANLIESGADSLLDSSADSYAVTRSAYLQRRAALIANQDDAGGAAGDDAGLDAALNELGPADGSGNGDTPGTATLPAAPTLAPDQAHSAPAPIDPTSPH